MTDIPGRLEYQRERLEYLRGRLRGECISWGELAELQELADVIEPGDVELLEPAGVPEQFAHVPVDFASSASRQHYIDTGRHLREGEALES